jgi:hypothetical protein
MHKGFHRTAEKGQKNNRDLLIFFCHVKKGEPFEFYSHLANNYQIIQDFIKD